MSQQRVQKKQLSSMDNVAALSDQELREALKSYAQAPGPITDSTRSLYRRKLASLLEEKASGDSIQPQQVIASSPHDIEKPRATQKSERISTARTQANVPATMSNNQADDDEDDDTSDEDYNVNQDEELESEDLEYEEDEEDEEEDEDDDESNDGINPLYEELKDKTINASSTSFASDISTTGVATRQSVVAANHISKGILIGVVSFFIAIFSIYLYSRNNQQLLNALKPYKNLTKQLIVLALLSPIGFIIYRLFAFYRLRRRQEAQKVCALVHDALELLQSPDNPTCQLPILHIRDTLLTPAERRSKTTINLWKKAVKFVEEHESRVKVEMVNIDGEDFRAWKWIGLVKH